MKSHSIFIVIMVTAALIASGFLLFSLAQNVSKGTSFPLQAATPSPPPSVTLAPSPTSTPHPYPLPTTPQPTVVGTFVPPTPIPAIRPTAMPPEVSDDLDPPRQITTRPAHRRELAMEGDNVAWVSHEDGRAWVVVYNLATNAERRISSLVGGKSGVRISGQYVVWQETLNWPNKVTEIRVYDLAANRELAVPSPAYAESHPDVSGHVVVWNDSRMGKRNSTGDIFGYNIQTGQTYTIAAGPGEHLFPRISGNWVIYLDWLPSQSIRVDHPKLRAHHLLTGENIELGPSNWHDDAFTLRCHVISGSRVVWQAVGGRSLNIYDLETRQLRNQPGPPSFVYWVKGSLVGTGSRIWNIDTGGRIDAFQPYRSDRPSQIDAFACDGRMMAWIYSATEGRVFVSRLRRMP